MINNINKTGGINPNNRSTTSSTKSGANVTSSHKAEVDKIDLSPEAKLLSQMQDVNPPAVNAGKIEALKLAISSGEYKIDYEKLSGNILQDHGVVKE